MPFVCAIVPFLRARLCPPPPAPARRILVAALLDKGEVVLNIGSNAGAALGQHFELLDEGTPITYEGELLGIYRRPAVTVVVTEVQARLVVTRRPRQAQNRPYWLPGELSYSRIPPLPDWVVVGSRARLLDAD